MILRTYQLKQIVTNLLRRIEYTSPSKYFTKTSKILANNGININRNSDLHLWHACCSVESAGSVTRVPTPTHPM